MKIAIASDIHLEFGDCEITNSEGADVLILAGDIMLADDLHEHPVVPSIYELGSGQRDHSEKQKRALRYREFFNHVAREFNDVIYIAGNHEFYHGKWAASLDHLREECKTWPNVHFLERESVTIMGVTFIGSTLWTSMNKADALTLHAVRDMMSDFHIIRDDTRGYCKLKPATTVTRHRESLQYIREVVYNVREKTPDAPVVVIGHHAPSSLSIAPQYAHQQLMNGAYYSDLSEFILDRPEIKLWVHGHMHDDFDYMIGDCRVVCNPRGYVGHESRVNEWKPLVIEL